jgi:uncharacterized protein YjbJ (UPF0337 family)
MAGRMPSLAPVVPVIEILNRRIAMKSSTKDNTEGKMHKVKGKIKETAGKAVGNLDLEAEGKVEKFEGEAQEKLGQIKKVLDK